MEDNLNIRQILEWYVTAGVDETFGEVPFGLEAPKPKVVEPPKPMLTTRAEDSTKPRAATTDLAQATISACKNARDICSEVSSLDELKRLVESFDGCALKLTANKTVFGGGNPNSKVMLIGEAPGADEDRIGLPFVGRSGHLLDKMLQAVGMDRNSCYITGGSAANALLDNEEPISRLRGKWLEYKTPKGKIIPVLASFHPAYLLRNTAQKAKAWVDLLRMKQKLMQ